MTAHKGNTCAILLAGGKSSRMGENKAGLMFHGMTLLSVQLEKLQNTCAEEILISGDPENIMPYMTGTDERRKIRVIPDIIKDRGPLGGLYSCFMNTECEYAITLSIDTPLVSCETLEKLLCCHMDNKTDATVLTVASHPEPLIAAYSTRTAETIKELIDSGDLAVRALLERISTHYADIGISRSELMNCNTKEDYEKLLMMR